MGSTELHTRYVEVGGYEYNDGRIHFVVGRRRFRIREYEDSQIHLRMLIAFAVGLVPFFVMLLFVVPRLIDAACK